MANQFYQLNSKTLTIEDVTRRIILRIRKRRKSSELRILLLVMDSNNNKILMVNSSHNLVKEVIKYQIIKLSSTQILSKLMEAG